MHGKIERNIVFLEPRSGTLRRLGDGLGDALLPGAAGFTLIELLVVIVIIGILISILIPAVGYVKTMAKKASTTALLNSIGTGLEAYYRDFNAYPPSNSTATSYSNATPAFYNGGSNGGLMLAEGLNGYLDYNCDGAGPSNSNANNKDPAYGFRTRSGGVGRIYGPYANPTASSWHVVDAAHQYFMDMWGNEIVYYRAIPITVNNSRRTVTSVFGLSTVNPSPAIFATDDNVKVFDTTNTEVNLADPSTKVPFLNLLGASGNTLAGGDIVTGKNSYLLVSAGPDMKFFAGDTAAAKPDDIIQGGK